MKLGIHRHVLYLLVLLMPVVVAAEEIRFNVEAWQIEGENPIGDARAQAILEPFLGPHAGLDALRQATKALENGLQEAGFTFYRVVLPPQSIQDGAVRLSVYPFIVGEISIDGNQYHGDDNIRASIPSLRTGESPNAKALSRDLALANMSSSKRAKLTFGQTTTAGELDARIDVVDRDPRRVYTWVNDTGTDDTGSYRWGVGYHDSNFLDRDQLLSATLTTSPGKFDQVVQAGLNWRMPLYRSNGIVSALLVDSDVDSGTVAEFFDVRGRGSIQGIAYSKVLPRLGNFRQLATIGVTDKFFDTDVEFVGQGIGVDVRSRPLHLEYAGEYRSDTANGRVSVRAVRNLSGGSHNDDVTYAAARAGADSDWDAIRVDGNIERVVKGYTLKVSAAAQFADEPLISGEQFGLGGVRSVRGFNEREFSGDRGYWLRFDAFAPRYANGLRFGWFMDGGQAERLEAGAGEAEKTNAISTGLSASWTPNQRLLFNAEFAHVLDLSGAVGGETRENDERAHFNVTYFFD